MLPRAKNSFPDRPKDKETSPGIIFKTNSQFSLFTNDKLP